jgi:adenylylsulfate kinase-like enzyme
VSDPYEPPTSPELHLRTDSTGREDCVQRLVGAILRASAHIE